jgi:tetratricopeptide (TPR) repeat protein
MKRIIFAANAILLLILSTITAQEKDTMVVKIDPQAAIHYNKAIESMKASNFEDAVVQFDSSLAITKDYKTYYNKAQALLKTERPNKYQEAKEALNACLALNNQYDYAINSLANIQLILKEYDDATANYEKVLQLTQNEELKKGAKESIDYINNTKAIEYYNTGNELSKAGKYDEALKNYDLSLAINNKDPKTYYQKGLTLSKMNKDDDAVNAFNQVIAVDNSFDLAYIALAGLMTKKSQFDEAVKDYEKVLAVSSNDALKTAAKEGISRTNTTLGNAALKEKKYDKAIEYFNKSVAQDNFGVAYLGLVKAYIEKKQYDNALKSVDSLEVYKKLVSDGAIDYYKGLIYFNKGDNKRAIDAFTAGLNDSTYKKACQSQIDYIKAKEKGARPKK